MTSQRITSQSLLPEARTAPEGAKRRAEAAERWPWSVASQAPVSASHSLMLPSACPLAIYTRIDINTNGNRKFKRRNQRANDEGIEGTGKVRHTDEEAAAEEEAMQNIAREGEEEEGAKVTEGRPRLRSQAARRSRAAARSRRPEGS